MKEWFQNKIDLLSTPLGAGVGLASILLGVMIGKLLMVFTESINNMYPSWSFCHDKNSRNRLQSD